MERALYQSHRPQKFKDMVGQEQVVSVLENAIKSDEIGHAYLFTGPRGIGKTSAARIFAREMEVQDADIFEIDAASHTSVENMKEIITSMYTQPSQSKHKVYIFDEVHMLSKSAFNAFLKTLEEPPQHVIFVLVTTEEDKIPETIVSRCIPLQFRQPSIALLKKTVIGIAKKEGYTLDEQSASLIALIANGSFRDSLTVLQKVLLVTDGKKVTREQIEQVLGIPSAVLVNGYLTALFARNVPEGVKLLETVLEKNLNILLFAKLCMRKLRAALLLKNGMEGVLNDYDEEDIKFIKELAENENLSVELLQLVSEAIDSIPRSYIKTLPLEFLLVGGGGGE